MRWNTTYHVRRDNSPRIDITADCTNGRADQLHVINWFSNLPGRSFQSWDDCGNIFIKEEGEIFFDKNSISTAVTNYEADVIFQKRLATASGEINHTYQRSSGSDPKVCGSGPCGDPNHDWLAKSLYINYNFSQWVPPNTGWTWTSLFGASRAYASASPTHNDQDAWNLSSPDAPFSIQVARDGKRARVYIEADFSDPVVLQSYLQWNASRARVLPTNGPSPVYVKVTFRTPVSIAEAQNLIDAVGLNLQQTTFVVQDKEGKPHNGGTLSDGASSVIHLGALQSIFEEKEIKLDGVMVIEGLVKRSNALQTLLAAPQVYLLDVTADFGLQKAREAGQANIQGIVVPSPYWGLYLKWLKR